MAASVALELTQSLFTNGARAAAVYFLQACYFLAIPQHAKDIPGGEAGVNAGNSNVSLMLYRADEGTSQFKEYQQLDVPGGEDAEFFTIDDRSFLATASIRSGSGPSYNMNAESCIFEWDGKTMAEFQCIPTFGAKQWRYFDIEGRSFLALAQGLEMAGVEPTIPSTNSTIFEWDGEKFQTFQTVPSIMGYNWLHFSLDGRDFLAYADHTQPSYILEWNKEKFVHVQTLDGMYGRAFCFFENEGRSFLAFARVSSDSLVYKWDGKAFQHFQTLAGTGGREFTVIEEGGSMYLAYVKLITGDKADPETALQSVIYRVGKDGLEVATEFPTFGGTDVSTFSIKDTNYLVVTESLNEEVRFRQDSHVYRFTSNKPSRTPTTGHSITKRSCPHLRRQDDSYVSPEFMQLFGAYTGGPSSIGYQFREISTEVQSSNPLIVATAEDIILYPGDGGDPAHLPYRFGTASFIEMTSISHLGPAVASLAEIYANDTESEGWRQYANSLLNAARAARSANSLGLWQDRLQVEAYQGREASIVDMVNYACDLTIRLLETVLEDPTKLTPEFLRENYLNATGGELGATVPINTVMTATFFLSAMNGALQTKTLLDQHDIDWTKVMILINGQMGRETAGVVLSSNTLAEMFLNLHPELPAERIYIAPQGLVPNVTDTSPGALRVFEPELRNLWGKHRGYVSLAGKMFAGYPAYKVAEGNLPVINATTSTVSELPAIAGPDDWLALTTRIRVTLEDPRQPLSGSITDYATQQLYEAGGDVAKVVVPGLDGYDYASALKDKPTS